MVSIGIRELRRNASRYIRLVKAGERVAVTEHGEVVAYLVPAEEPNSILDRLEAAGQNAPTWRQARERDRHRDAQRGAVVIYFDTSAFVKLI